MANEPVKKYQDGTVQIAVWENQRQTKDGKAFTAVSYSLQNRKMIGEEWKDVAYSKQDLVKLFVLIIKAMGD